MNYKVIEKIIDYVPRRGMSRDCQKFLPHAIHMYFRRDIGFHNLKHRKKAFADEAIKRVEKIRESGLRKMLGEIIVGHPKDYMDPVASVDITIKYCAKKKLKTKFQKASKDYMKKEDFERRVKDQRSEGDRSRLKDFGKSPEFYLFLRDEIIPNPNR